MLPKNILQFNLQSICCVFSWYIVTFSQKKALNLAKAAEKNTATSVHFSGGGESCVFI